MSRVRQIFEHALGISDAYQRNSFLVDQCGNDETLLARLNGMLSTDTTSFLEVPIAKVDIDECYYKANEGLTIDGFELLAKVGEGTFGMVYRAHQVKPVRRLVAIKVIRPGMDTERVSNRFSTEQQALAMLQHPNIAGFYAAGKTACGRPYYAMEFIAGVPINQFVQQQACDLQTRIRLFLKTCYAVQHAHQKGIIHRDLKPSNVLVCHENGAVVVKVIDFGIAKVTQEPSSGDQTLPDQLIGTPNYMSPEQAARDPSIDTRSDIYSLGAILYELLTGRSSISGPQKELSLAESIHRIIHLSPPKPSTVPQTEGPISQSSMLGDLDCIVMTALAKDRSERYQTVDAFVDDLQCFLDNKPCKATAPTLSYRLTKFAKRNRLLLGATAAIFVAAMVALVAVLVAGYQVVVASEKLAQSNLELKDKHGQLTTSLMETQNARHKAEQLLYEASIVQAEKAIRDGQNASAIRLLKIAPKSLRNWEWQYLQSQTGRIANPLLDWNHGNAISAIAWKPDGSMYAFDVRGQLSYWDRDRTHRRQWQTPTRQFGVASFAMNRDRTIMAISESMDQSNLHVVKIFDCKQPTHEKEIARIPMELSDSKDQVSGITCLAFSRDDAWLAIGVSNDVTAASTIFIYDWKLPKHLHSLIGHEEMVCAVDFGPDRSFLISTSMDGTVKKWTWDGHISNRNLQRLKGRVQDQVVVSPDGERAVAGSPDGYLTVWKLDTEVSIQLQGHTGHVLAALWLDEHHLLSAGKDGTVKSWDVRDGSLLQTFQMQRSGVCSMDVDESATAFAAGGFDGTVRIQALTMNQSSIARNHGEPVAQIIMAPDEMSFVSIGESGSAITWNSSSTERTSIQHKKTSILAARYLENGNVETIDAYGNVAPLANRQKPARSNSKRVEQVNVAAWSDQLYFARGNALYCRQHGRDKKRLDTPYAIRKIAIADQQDRVVVSCGNASVWMESSGSSLVILINGTTEVFRKAIIGGIGAVICRHEQIVIGKASGDIEICNFQGEVASVLQGHTGPVRALAVSADRNRLFSAADDKQVIVWDLQSLQPLIHLAVKSPVRALATSATSQRVIAGCHDGRIYVW